jgi:hypothetical protein
MFIQKGNKRINLNSIKEYKPTEKTTISGNKTYYIEIIYLDGTQDNYFFLDPEARDELLKKLDNFLLKQIKNE